jgi:hypothetical protein
MLRDTLYLILKFGAVLRQPFDHDIGSGRRTGASKAYKKQTLTDLEFVLGHNPPPQQEIKRRNRVAFEPRIRGTRLAEQINAIDVTAPAAPMNRVFYCW